MSLQHYNVDIPFREGMMPTSLGFIFDADSFLCKVIIQRPAPKGNVYFSYRFKTRGAKDNKFLFFYFDGQRLLAHRESDTETVGYIAYDPTGLIQDLEACGYTSNTFPALKKYLEV